MSAQSGLTRLWLVIDRFHFPPVIPSVLIGGQGKGPEQNILFAPRDRFARAAGLTD
jgi:hypothetical protein